MKCFAKIIRLLLFGAILLPGLAHADTAVGFFTTVADTLLRSQFGLSATNIPVYTNNTFAYTPAVHRLLQLSANIYDATTNRPFEPGGANYCPTVFRPTFKKVGNDVFINGFVEEGADSVSYQPRPFSLPEDLGLIDAGTTNIYGIPYIIGARKGLPNFNEFYTASFSQITRQVQIDKGFANSPRALWKTNELYTIGISNLVGVEAWNSYTNPYPRDVNLVLFQSVGMSLTISNDTGVSFVTNQSLSVTTNVVIPANQWLGYAGSANPAADAVSFRIPFAANLDFVPDSFYYDNPPRLEPAVGVTNALFQPTADRRPPHFVLSLTNRLQFVLCDVATGRLIDYVTLAPPVIGRDLTQELPAHDPLGVWNPNGPSDGVFRQVEIAAGNINLNESDWNNAQLQPLVGAAKADAITAFHNFVINPFVTNVAMAAPFMPTAKFSQSWSWQANDPLVHYLIDDLTSFPQTNQFRAIIPPSGRDTNSLGSIRGVNARYKPWGGNPFVFDSATDYHLEFKDPLIRNSDAWDFPADQSPGVNWLGRVHRGTPWQTVYLKSAPVDANTWQSWTGNANVADAQWAQPTNDWRVVEALARLFNTNSPRALLSINQMTPANWSAQFGDTVVVQTNISSDAELQNTFPPPAPQFDPLVLDANAPQTSLVLDVIHAAQRNRPDHYFHDVGDLLAIPELSVNAPWLNESPIQLQRGLTDAAYESLVAQILGSLRPDSIGRLLPGTGAPQLQFTGFDGYVYTVQTSTDLVTWTGLGVATPTNGVFTFTGPAPASSRRFYRSVLVP